MNPRRIAAIALALCLPPGLVARAGAQAVPLDLAVSSDAHLVVHGIASRTPDPGMLAVEKAFRRLAASGIHEDVLDLATLGMRPGQARRVRATVDRVLGLLGEVDWADLVAREVLFVERFALPVPEYSLVCRVPEDRAAEHLAALRRMFGGFAEMIGAGRAEVADVAQEDGALVVFRMHGVPLQFTAGAVRGALVLSTSAESASAALRRLRHGGDGSLHDDEGYQRTLRQLPTDTEGTVYVDCAGLMDFFREVLDTAGDQAAGDSEAGTVLAICRALLAEFDIVDHLAVSTASDGRTVTETTLVRMKPGHQDSRLVQLYAKQRAWTDWHRYVPADATGFVFDTGIDVGGTLDWLTHVAVESAGGAEAAPWAQSRVLTRIREVFGHLSGETAWIAFPRAGQRGCPMGETVLMMRLEKTDGVSAWLRRHLDAFSRYAGDRGQEVEIETRGDLHDVAIAAFPWLRPVVGVQDGMLVVASSAAAIEAIARVRRGEAADIRSSERFAGLGLGGRGVYLAYQQVDGALGGCADLFSGAGFVLSMLPQERDARPAIVLGTILGKLAAAMRELDVSFDTGSEVLPAPSEDVALMRRVTRYR